MRNVARESPTGLSVAGLLLAGSAALSLSCSGDSGREPATSGPGAWTVAVEPTVSIGEVEGDEPYLFTSIRAASFLPDRGIAVIDSRADGIRIFSPEGTFLRELGRKGEGPGEFSYPYGISVVPPDTLEIYDSRLYRLNRFLVSGSLLSTLQLQAEDGMPEMYLGRYSSGELAFAWIVQGSRDWSKVTPDPMQLARFDANGRMTGSLGTAEGILRSSSGVYALSPYLYAELMGDFIYLTNGLVPEIEIRDREGVMVGTLPVPAPEGDFTTAWAALERTIAARGFEIESTWLENQPDHGPVPSLGRLLADQQDRLWVKEFDPVTDNLLITSGRLRGGTWWVLSTTGDTLATVGVPDDFTLLDVREDRALGKTRDELGVERIEVRRIQGMGY